MDVIGCTTERKGHRTLINPHLGSRNFFDFVSSVRFRKSPIGGQPSGKEMSSDGRGPHIHYLELCPHLFPTQPDDDGTAQTPT